MNIRAALLKGLEKIRGAIEVTKWSLGNIV